MDAETERLMRRVAELSAQRERRRTEYRTATERLRAVIVALAERGMSESAIARAAGISRQSIRTWTGKEPWPTK